MQTIKYHLARALPPSWASVLRRLLNDVRIAFRETHSPIVLPWFAFARGRDEMESVHLIASQLHRQHQVSKGRDSRSLAIAGVLWPLVLLRQGLIEARAKGRLVRQRYGVSVARQIAHIVKLGLVHNISANDYYAYGMYKNGNRSGARYYVAHHEIIRLLPKVNVRPTKAGIDKFVFYRHCLTHRLPTPGVLAHFRDGKRLDADDTATLPREDLFSKQTNFWGGHGAARWLYQESTSTWEGDGYSFSEPELMAHLLDRSREAPVVLQKRLFNHPDIEDLSCGGLVVARIISAVDGEGSVRILTSAMKSPRGNSHIDHFHAGGITAAIDLDTGTLSAAVSSRIGEGPFRQHPDTGGKIEGRRLPLWDEAKALVGRAHVTFPQFPLIGWDVAWTVSGPVLLEANLTWGVVVVQTANDAPLGLTGFPSLYLDALARVNQRDFV